MTTLLRVIDFETTGFPPNAGVIEVGVTDVLVHKVDPIEIKPRGAMLCNPGMPISYGAMAVHHIREKDLIGAPPAEEVLRKISTNNAFAYVAHYAEFEQKFYTFPKQWLCTKRLAQLAWPNFEAYNNQAIRYQLKLDDMDDFVPSLANPAHRAGPDTYVTAHILVQMLKVLPLQKMVEAMNEAIILHSLPFGKHRGIPMADVPSDYLQWILRQDKAEPDVRATAEHHLKLRGVL
jgi:exodeoxyribonuclease X